MVDIPRSRAAQRQLMACSAPMWALSLWRGYISLRPRTLFLQVPSDDYQVSDGQEDPDKRYVRMGASVNIGNAL